MLHRFADIHTHIAGRPNSILSIPAEGVERIVHSGQHAGQELQCFSLQLHPWHLTGQGDIDRFAETAFRYQYLPQFVAIGECGLDGLCPTPLGLQRTAFREALRVARQLRRPVIVHCVRLWAEMMGDVHTVFPELRTQPDAWREWPVIIHGFRKGPELARQLLNAGFSISLGTKYNPDVAKILPSERCYAETDEE